MNSASIVAQPSRSKLPDEIRVRSLRQLKDHCVTRYGSREDCGWAPRRRSNFGYFLPSELYESALDLLIWPGCSWIDVGGGHHVCPENDALAHALAARCEHAVAVDPSANVHANPFMRERVQSTIEDYAPSRLFDVASLRMVVEHMSDPRAATQALARLVRPGGVVVLLTVNKWSPVSLVSMLTPMRLHHPIKKVVWGGAPEDTFPIEYLMNTKRDLHRAFTSAGFDETFFAWADDLSIFGLNKAMGLIELLAWKFLQRVGVRYPENCLLAVYQRVAPPDPHNNA